MAPAVVLGAGVVGLQTANTLLDAGYKVIILAKHWPGDETIEYTSPWAGAIWRPHATSDDVEECEWNNESYDYGMKITAEKPEEAEKMGIRRVPITIFSNDDKIDPNAPNLWFSSYVQNFSIFSPSELPPNGAKSAYTYTSTVINPHKYLNYLLARAKQLGAQTITAELPSSKGFAYALSTLMDQNGNECNNDALVMVNCTGLGAAGLCNDAAMYPIRGQTLLVRITPPPPITGILLYDAKPVTYIVPRTGSDTYLFGGTNDVNSWDAAPKPEISQAILQRCKEMMKGWAADDAQIEVLSEQVGLRPGRKWGVRIEPECVEVQLKGGTVKKVYVVHHYGHAGAGYQNALGSANKVLGMVKEISEGSWRAD